MTQSKAILDVFETSAAKRPASLYDKATAARQVTGDERDAQSAPLEARRLAHEAGVNISDDAHEPRQATLAYR